MRNFAERGIKMGIYQEKVLQTEDRTLCGYYLDKGSENTLVLVPGSYASHTIWKPVVQNANIPANLFLVELPGFGKSTPKEPDSTIEEITAHILTLIDGVGIDRFFIGGHSLGGMIATEMLDHAGDRLEGVISCEGWVHHSVEQDTFLGRKNETLSEHQLALRKHYGTVARTAWTDEEIGIYSKIWKKWEKGQKLLEETKVPVLEIWGDRGMPRPDRKALLLPPHDNITLIWLPNGGHSFLVQYPEEVGQMIADFIRERGKR